MRRDPRDAGRAGLTPDEVDAVLSGNPAARRVRGAGRFRTAAPLLTSLAGRAPRLAALFVSARLLVAGRHLRSHAPTIAGSPHAPTVAAE